MSVQKFLTFDIGSAWTKAFLVNIDAQNTLNIEQSARLPSSWGDFSVSVKLLQAKFPTKDVTKIFVSHLPEIETLAKKEGATFVKEQDAAYSLVQYLKKSDTNVTILDGGASNLHETAQAEDIGKYLTFPSSAIYLENLIGKKKFKPHLLPTDIKEVEIEEAFLRTIFADKLANLVAHKKILIAVTGGMISGSPRLSRTALLILDSMGPGTLAQVIYDREFFLPSFGALLAKYKQLQVSTPGEWLDDLGLFASLGGPQKIELDWGFSQVQKVELADGEISLIPAPKNQKIKLTLPFHKNDKRHYNIFGGSLGVVLDARSKPLPLVFGQATSRKLMTSWFKELEQAEINREAF